MQILKEQNAIRMAIVAVLFNFSVQLIAQEKLEGNFSKLAALQDYYDYYSFDETGSFEYHQGASLGDSYYGYGKYKLDNNLLILNYNRTKNKSNSNYKSSFWINSDETVLLNFKVKDENGTPLLGVFVEIAELHISSTTNADGEVSLTIDKSNSSFSGKVYDLGYDACNFVFDSNKNYLINVFLNNKPIGLPLKNQIDTLEVQDRGASLVLKNKENKVSKWKKIQD